MNCGLSRQITRKTKIHRIRTLAPKSRRNGYEEKPWNGARSARSNRTVEGKNWKRLEENE